MKIELSLKDVYFGAHKKLVIRRNEICVDCSGSGLKVGAVLRQCGDCQGRGYKVTVTKMGPFIQQIQSDCPSCVGAGSISAPDDLCGKCKGAKITVEDKNFDCTIQRGAVHGQQIVFPEESHRHPDYQPNDVILIIAIETHPLFKRENYDLHYQAQINLIDALTEAILLIPHVNGDILCLKHSGPLSSGTRTLKGYGLPSSDDSKFGDLIITFTINYPNSLQLTPEQEHLLRQILPPSNNPHSIPGSIVRVDI